MSRRASLWLAFRRGVSNVMAQFGWLSAGPISAGFDLRRCAWDLIAADIATSGRTIPLLLFDQTVAAGLRTRTARAAVTPVGIDEPIRRSHFLALGFGEVLPRDITLDELAALMGRVTAGLGALPRRSGHGLLQLDLLTREGHVGERRLARCTRANSRCLGGWPKPRVSRSPPTLC